MRDLSRGTLGSMNDKINLAEKFAQLPDAYQPAIVGYMNDYKLVVVKTQGEFVWHKHDETDELFLIVAGRLTIQFRDRDVVLEPGELFVVPRGVEHCPKADEETHVLLIEPRETSTPATRAASRRSSRSRSERHGGRRPGAVREIVRAHNTVLGLQSGFDPFYGRRVCGDIADAGFADVACEGHASMWRGGRPAGGSGA